jgi:hypothetical protein
MRCYTDRKNQEANVIYYGWNAPVDVSGISATALTVFPKLALMCYPKHKCMCMRTRKYNLAG